MDYGAYLCLLSHYVFFLSSIHTFPRNHWNVPLRSRQRQTIKIEISFRWFEFSISFYLIFGLSIEIGLYAGPFKITLFKISEGAEEQLVEPLEWDPAKQPGANDSIGAFDVYTSPFSSSLFCPLATNLFFPAAALPTDLTTLFFLCCKNLFSRKKAM